MKADAFKPASGSKEVMVQGNGMQGPQLGDHFRVQATPTPVQQAPMAVKQGSAQFVPASQPVQLAGSAPPVGEAQQPPAPAARPEDKFRPAAPADQVVQPSLGAQQPRAFPHRQAPQQAPAVEQFSISIDGVAPDGQQYTAEYTAAFPAGTKILGTARIQPLG